MEEWKPYVYNYDVSNYGRIRNRVTNHILRPKVNRKGYCLCTVSCGSRDKKICIRIHRAVAELFLQNLDGKPEVNHKDCNKSNNNVANLEWVYPVENTRHAMEYGLRNPIRGEKNVNSKLTIDDVKFIRSHYISGDRKYGARALARKYNVHHSAIEKIVNGTKWRYS